MYNIEDMDCEKCGALGSLVWDGDFDVECLACGETYALVGDEDEWDNEDDDDSLSDDEMNALAEERETNLSWYLPDYDADDDD